jgi:hypothetical protein
MKFKFYIFLTSMLFIFNASAQQIPVSFPQKEINKFNAEALQRVKAGATTPINFAYSNEVFSSPGSVFYNLKYMPQMKINSSEKLSTFINSDTLFIGDTTVITGEWLQSGTIVIYGNGRLHFNKASATILGDIYLLNDAVLQADSSTLYIPQAYFYQRAVVATGGSRVIYRHTTVDHSNLSHSIVLVDSARLELIDVTNHGFTTNGIYHNSSVYVDGTNQAGEYVIVDESALEFHNANTVLLWHQFPETAVVDFNFPANDTVGDYLFNSSVPGVMGIGYSILLDNCTDVMWGMMPATGSDITITGSEIRAIGLWFMGSDTVNVKGLVNNSYYEDFHTPLDDRNLRLIGCDVTTWSIYPMDQSVVNLSGCIVGEVGPGKRSILLGSQFFCDGSGGYVWTSDTAFMLAGYSYTSGYVRSQANSILMYAYSSVSGGYLSALHNSIIMAIQCTLPEEPRAYDKGVAWYALIEGPSEAYAGENVIVIGSAWIDKTAISELMDFGSYRLYYQEAESLYWTEIPVDSLNEKRKETLGIWNTGGLNPGQYLLKMILTDDLGNSVEAVKTFSLQPSFGINEMANPSVLLFPNPAEDMVTIRIPEFPEHLTIRITDISGRICYEKEIPAGNNQSEMKISVDVLEMGVYQVNIISDDRVLLSDILIKQ